MIMVLKLHQQYLKEVLGKIEAEKILAPLLYITDDPETIPFDALSEEYIIKPNHSSGRIILAETIETNKKYTVKDASRFKIFLDDVLAKREIIKTCKKWLSIPYAFHKLLFSPVLSKYIKEGEIFHI